jgi:membrane protease YdiL (CAAX protease family)
MGLCSYLFLQKSQESSAHSTMQMLSDQGHGELALIAFTAGFTEELVYRAIALERIAQATGSLWVGAVVSGLAVFSTHTEP